MFFDCIIIKYNYDMYMLWSYATEHWQRAGGEEKTRHAIVRLCYNKTMAALNAVILRRPRLGVGMHEHMETPKRTVGTGIIL